LARSRLQQERLTSETSFELARNRRGTKNGKRLSKQFALLQS
jgi:hypothetical protein